MLFLLASLLLSPWPHVPAPGDGRGFAGKGRCHRTAAWLPGTQQTKGQRGNREETVQWLLG